MKKHLELIIVFLGINLIAFVIYLMGVFCNCSWDRCLWTNESIGVISIFMGLCLVFSILIPIIIYLENKNN